jgi:hypothetical protein
MGFIPAREMEFTPESKGKTPLDRFPTRKKIRLPLSVYNQGHAFFVTVATYKKYRWSGSVVWPNWRDYYGRE